MEIQYKRTNRESYMIIENAQTISKYEERMLKENDIHCLLPFHTMSVNGAMQFWHDISGKQSLRNYFEQEMISLELLDKLFTSLSLAFEELGKYLIQQHNIVLDPDTVYLSRQERFRVYLCFLPSDRAARNEPAFSSVMEHIIDCVDQNDEELTALCYELYEMSLQEHTTLYELRDRIQRDCEKKIFQDKQIEELVQQIKPREVQDNRREEGEFFDDDYGDDLEDEDISEEKCADDGEGFLIQIVSRVKNIVSKIGSSKTKVSDDVKHEDFMVEPEPEICEKTQLLFQNQGARGNLIYQGNFKEENFTINRDMFRIGHEREGNEGFLNGIAVSRYHAKIYREGTSFYIEDLNSTNGTYVNGEQLNYTEKVLLSPMDKIIFGDVPYLFV